MPRKKRNIVTIVHMPDPSGVEEFQNRINEIYCEMVRQRLLKANVEMDKKNFVLDELVRQKREQK